MDSASHCTANTSACLFISSLSCTNNVLLGHWTCSDGWYLLFYYMQMKCSCWMMHYNLSRSHRVEPVSTSPGSTMQTDPLLMHSRQCVSVCVITHVWLPPSDHSSPSISITPSFSVHRANRVCACVTHSRLRLITLLYNLTDRWVFLWLTHSLKQAQKRMHGCVHITLGSHWVISLYLQPCVLCVLYGNLLTLKCKETTGNAVHTDAGCKGVCCASASDEHWFFRHTDAPWKEVCSTTNWTHPTLEKKWMCIISFLALIKGYPTIKTKRYTAGKKGQWS